MAHERQGKRRFQRFLFSAFTLCPTDCELEYPGKRFVPERGLGLFRWDYTAVLGPEHRNETAS